MIHILFDTNDGYPFLASKLGLSSVSHYSPRSSKKYLSWLKGCLNVVRKVRSGDTVICIYDFQGVLCYWLSRLVFKKINILAVNVLLKDKDSLRNRVATTLYRGALKSDRCVATVTTVEYGEWLRKKLNLNRMFPILKDVYYSSYEEDMVQENSHEPYLFCGGRNGRDWNFAIRLAGEMPDINFKLVLPSSMKDALGPLPKNVDCRCDIPNSEFSQLLHDSEMVILPLDTEAPAGLIVVFQAAAFKKPLLITSTVSTREYMADERGVALEPDVALWKDNISRLLSDKVRMARLGDNLYNYVRTECSEEAYCKRMAEIATDSFTDFR